LSCLAPLGNCRGRGAVAFASDARGRFLRAPPNSPTTPIQNATSEDFQASKRRFAGRTVSDARQSGSRLGRYAKKTAGSCNRSFTTVVAMLSLNACRWNSQPITGKLAMTVGTSSVESLAAIKPPIPQLAGFSATRIKLTESALGF
jgi:hypothetical protein